MRGEHKIIRNALHGGQLKNHQILKTIFLNVSPAYAFGGNSIEAALLNLSISLQFQKHPPKCADDLARWPVLGYASKRRTTLDGDLKFDL